MLHTNAIFPERRYRLLAAPRRRYLLWHLSRRESTTVEEAAARIAAWEAGVSADEVAQELYDRVRLSLVHSHLPRLADHAVVDYDRASGEVELQTELSGWLRTDDPPVDLDGADTIDRS